MNYFDPREMNLSEFRGGKSLISEKVSQNVIEKIHREAYYPMLDILDLIKIEIVIKKGQNKS